MRGPNMNSAERPNLITITVNGIAVGCAVVQVGGDESVVIPRSSPRRDAPPVHARAYCGMVVIFPVPV